MADWLDANMFIESAKRWYRFPIAPRFWTFIEDQGQTGRLLSSSLVRDEVSEGNDDVARWVKERKDSGLFVEPGEDVQERYRQIAEHVAARHEERHVRAFLDKADPWVIAHAMSDGGRVLSLEKWDDTTRRIKIPNLCSEIGVECPRNPFEVLEALGLFLG